MVKTELKAESSQQLSTRHRGSHKILERARKSGRKTFDNFREGPIKAVRSEERLGTVLHNQLKRSLFAIDNTDWGGKSPAARLNPTQQAGG